MNNYNNGKVYISLTTISPRINEIYETISSLISQTYPVTKITLYISQEGYILDKGVKNIPKELKILQEIDSRFHIIYVENTGSYRKLIPALKEHWNENCLIITVDDDKVYSPDMVSNMVEEYNRLDGRCIIANRAFVKVNRILKNLCEDIFSIPKEVTSIILSEIKDKGNAQTISYSLSNRYNFIRAISFFEGNDGVLYHPKFFTPIVYNYRLINKLAKTHDDFWFKICALINGYGVSCVNPFRDRKSVQRENTKNSALHFNVNIGTYEKSFNNLIRWFHQEKLLESGFRLSLKI